MKYLIINADDFGLDETVNLGIIQGHTSGVITSASIMPSGRAFTHGANLALANPELGIGVHLTLVGEKPVCDPRAVPSLVDKDGYLPPQYPQFLLRYLFGSIQLADIRRELTAQVQKVVDSGIHITHLDSHQHLHIMPGIIAVTLDIAQKFGIKAIRIPAEPYFFTGGYSCSPMRLIARAGLTFLARLAAKSALRKKIGAPEHFFGMLAGGNLGEERLLSIIDALPDGISEIMMHPGTNNEVLNNRYNWNYHGEEELTAATSDNVRQCLANHNIYLISFRDVRSKGDNR